VTALSWKNPINRRAEKQSGSFGRVWLPPLFFRSGGILMYRITQAIDL
jgi:hypothetical protein